MQVKYIAVINSKDNILICSKQFKNTNDVFNYIKCFDLDNYRVDIYNIVSEG